MDREYGRSILARASYLMARFHLDDARTMLQPLAAGEAILPRGRRNLRNFWRDAGEILADAGMSEAAETAWKNALANGLESFVADLGIQYARLLAGRTDEALGGLQSLAAALPGNGVVQNLHAIALFEAGRFEEAAAVWALCRRISAHRKCPLSTHPAHLALGAMALEKYLAEAALAPSHEPLVSGRAPGLTASRRQARIEQAWEEGRFFQVLAWLEAEQPGSERQEPNGMSLIQAFALAACGRGSEARAVAADVLAKDPDSPMAQACFARGLISSHESGLALGVIDRISPAGPDDFFTNYLHALAWLHQADRVRAVLAFRKAFSEYFYDSYHSLLLPSWNRMVLTMSQRGQAA